MKWTFGSFFLIFFSQKRVKWSMITWAWWFKENGMVGPLLSRRKTSVFSPFLLGWRAECRDRQASCLKEKKMVLWSEKEGEKKYFKGNLTKAFSIWHVFTQRRLRTSRGKYLSKTRWERGAWVARLLPATPLLCFPNSVPFNGFKLDGLPSLARSRSFLNLIFTGAHLGGGEACLTSLYNLG